MVVRGDIDVAVTYRYEALDDAPVAAPPVRSPLASIPLLTDHVHLVLPEQHPLAHTAPTGLWPLADESWLVGSDLFVDLLQRAAARAGFAARIANVADDAMSMQALVAQGVGVALLPGLALVAYQRPDLVAHPLPGWPARRGRGGDVARPAARAVGGGDGRGARRRRHRDGGDRGRRPRGRAGAAVGGTAPGVVPTAEDDGSDRWAAWYDVPETTLPVTARDRPDRAVFVSDTTGSLQVHVGRTRRRRPVPHRAGGRHRGRRHRAGRRPRVVVRRRQRRRARSVDGAALRGRAGGRGVGVGRPGLSRRVGARRPPRHRRALRRRRRRAVRRRDDRPRRG